MSHRHDVDVPRAALLGAGALVALTLVLATAGSMGWLGGQASLAPSVALEHRDLRFDDRADGGIDVTDVSHASGTAELIAVLAAGQHGFVRGMVRNLARERMQHKLDSSTPFRLTRWSDGHLSLSDLATGRVATLEGFGATNRAAFEQLLLSRSGVGPLAAHSIP